MSVSKRGGMERERGRRERGRPRRCITLCLSVHVRLHVRVLIAQPIYRPGNSICIKAHAHTDVILNQMSYQDIRVVRSTCFNVLDVIGIVGFTTSLSLGSSFSTKCCHLIPIFWYTNTTLLILTLVIYVLIKQGFLKFYLLWRRSMMHARRIAFLLISDLTET